MPDKSYWSDHAARRALRERGRAVLERMAGRLVAGTVVAIEPDSGDCFVGSTLGKANDLAYARYPDQWLYFCRSDDPDSEIVLPTW